MFNPNSKDTARITHLISERSLHRQLPRLRTAYRSQKKPSIFAAGTKRDVEAQSGCIIAPQRSPSVLVCLTRFVLVFVQHGVSTNFTRASPAELNYFKAGPVHGIFARSGAVRRSRFGSQQQLLLCNSLRYTCTECRVRADGSSLTGRGQDVIKHPDRVTHTGPGDARDGGRRLPFGGGPRYATAAAGVDFFRHHRRDRDGSLSKPACHHVRNGEHLVPPEP